MSKAGILATIRNVPVPSMGATRVSIVITMWAVWWGAGKVPTDVGSKRAEDMSHAERVSGLAS